MHKDNVLIAPILLIGFTMIVLILVLFIAAITALYQKRQADLRLEIEKYKSEIEKELMQSQIETQQQTFEEIAQEIHDNIGQKISMAKLLLNTVNDKGKELENSQHASTLLTQVMTDIRELSHTISSNTIKSSGLAFAIKSALSLLAKSEKMQTELITEGLVYELDEKTEFVLFRIFQELLNNIIKHAGAKNIIVQLTYSTYSLSMNIKDDGIGFDAAKMITNDASGLGLTNIMRRSKLIKASVNFQSSSGKTEVEVVVPHTK